MTHLTEYSHQYTAKKTKHTCSQLSGSIATTVYLLLHKTFMQLPTRSRPTLSPFLSKLWIDILQEQSHCSLQFSPLLGEHKCTPGYLWHHHGNFFIATLLPPWLLVQQSLSQLHDTHVAAVALLQHCLLTASDKTRCGTTQNTNCNHTQNNHLNST